MLMKLIYEFISRYFVWSLIFATKKKLIMYGMD